jgi:hypothetical protein
VGLSYNRKFEGFFRLIGRESRVITIEDFVAKRQSERLASLLTGAIREQRTPAPELQSLAETTRSFTARILSGRVAPPPPEPAPATDGEVASTKKAAP